MSDNDKSDEDIWNYGSQSIRPKRRTLGNRNNHSCKQISSNIAHRTAVRKQTKKDHSKGQEFQKKGSKVSQERKPKKQTFQKCKPENEILDEENRDKIVFQQFHSLKRSDPGLQIADEAKTKLQISEMKNADTQSQGSKSSQVISSQTPCTPQSEKKRREKKKCPGSANKTPKRPPHEGFCPFCQMPFCILLIESPRWHTMECMDVPLIALEECPAGLSCDNTIASHYRKFKHTLLTNHRAGVGDKEEKSTTAKSGDKEEKSTTAKSGNKEVKSTTAKSSNKEVKSTTAKSGNKEEKSTTAKSGDSAKGQERKRLQSLEDDSFVPNSKRSKLNNEEQQDDIRQNAKRQLFVEDNLSVGDSDSDIFDSDDNEEDKNGDSKTGLSVQSVDNVTGELFNTEESAELDSKTNSCVSNLTDTGERVCTEDSAESEREVSALLEDVFNDVEIDAPEVLEVATPVVENCYSNTSELRESEEQDIENAVEALAQNQCDINESDSDENTCQSTQSSAWCNTEENDENTTDFKDLISGVEFDEVMENEPTSVIKPPTSAHNEIKKETQLHSVQKQSSLLSFFLPNGTNKTVPQGTDSGTKAGNYLTNSLQKFTSYFTGSASSSTHSKNSTSNKQFGRGLPKTSENETTNESASYGGSRKPFRQCPFYKKIPGTPFSVDAFRYGSIPGCKVYFLTHFHYDHYGGLTKHFKHPIYCSKITANLVNLKIRTDRQYLHALKLNTEYTIEGVKVTFLEANHCPGAVLILFKLPNGQVHLHTGDFRADQSMEEYPALKGIRINLLYLDTTYCDPQYAFPPQNDVIKFAAKLAEDTVYTKPNTLFVVGSYTIGKERIFLAIAEALNCKICVIRDKKNILDCIDDPSIQRRLTMKPLEAKVHVLQMGKLRFDNLTSYLSSLKPRFDNIVALEPTGWSYSNKVTSLENIKPTVKRDNITIYGVPYSEHSSYTEMKRFVQFCRPEKVLPTVNNGNPSSRKKMETLFKVWLDEVNKTPTKKMKQTGLNAWLSPSQKK